MRGSLPIKTLVSLPLIFLIAGRTVLAFSGSAHASCQLECEQWNCRSSSKVVYTVGTIGPGLRGCPFGPFEPYKRGPTNPIVEI
jgi:hypothetical protein